MRSIFFIWVAGLLSACNTINYVGIETYNPAEVTFPENVAKVLIVNNAVPQPENTGYEYVLRGETQDTCKAKVDSALFDACRTLGEAIVEASYFNDVLLYHDAVRKDNLAHQDTKLTQEQVESLCNETGADAVISIDRLLFDMKKNISTLGERYIMGVIDVRMAGVVRSYMPDREAPLATIHMKDSIYWAESADYMPVLDKILPSPENALRGAGEYFGAKVYTNFVPHWEKEVRWYFTGMGARWKEASAYATNEKWDMAEERWSQLYQGTENWKSRAKAASNLALCNEMKGDLKEAYEWAHKSYDLFKRNYGDKGKSTKLLELYVKALAERIRSDKKLNVQFGED
ncbi:DUF6340 family protein [uncultured Parabacteroides sp.]|uniref:DUF6340 family protein n=1 Tax=uncultured Parabacteroides sp. TaxID=512312 RepID=UPI00260D3A98|nr:DUF6340 family protein [uncultured Parabacteroides sp.]